MDRKQIEKLLREIIAKRVPTISAESINVDTELTALGLDSLGFSWMLADMEDTFEFIIQGADILKLRTLGHTIDYVQKHVSA